jgi:hypothetical protein
MKIRALPNDRYCLDADIQYWQDITDVKIIDGKEYKHLTRELIQANTIDLINNHKTYEVSVDECPFGNIYHWLELRNLSFADFYQNGYYLSTNHYVRIWTALFDNGYLDKRIQRVFTASKIHSFMNTGPKDHGNIFYLPLFDYGFNNSFVIQISLESFFGIEDKRKLKYYYEIKSYFDRTYQIDIDEEIGFKQVIKILKKKIEKTTI